MCHEKEETINHLLIYCAQSKGVMGDAIFFSQVLFFDCLFSLPT